MRPTRLCLTATASLLIAACGGQSTASTGSSAGGTVLNVVTTTTQITDFTINLGGRRVKVYAVLKANIDPHDYEPTPADLDAISKADVIVKNGVGLEKWFDDTIKSADPKGTIVDASRGVRIRPGADGSDGDPHIWHNPENAKIMVTNIAKALEAVDPQDTASFEKNLTDYRAQLDRLDSETRALLATLSNKKLVTNHDAFRYYIDHYGLDFVGSVIPSFDTQTELSPQDVGDLVAKIKAQGVKAVFSESSLPSKTAAAIAKAAGVKVIAGEDGLFGDTLGPPGSDADTYLKMERHNTTEIVDNLR
jgi:ABC-type Zn uptake system ZnuABC Zn-binding protein ZnuA